MRSFLIAAVASLALTALLLWAVLDQETLHNPAQLRITIVFFALVAIAIVAAVWGGYWLRQLYEAVRADLTTVTDAAAQVHALIAQTEALIEANRVAWDRFSAAAEDAERQRVRFLETKARERAANESRPDSQLDG